MLAASFDGRLAQLTPIFFYIIAFLIMYVENGIMLGFILPGDSLLFSAGLVAASNKSIDIALLCLVVFLGAFIGDNTLPWAKNISGIIYAIDPSFENCEFIDKMAKNNELQNIKIFQTAISDCDEILSTNENLHHCSFVFGNPGTTGANKVNATTLDKLFQTGHIENIGYIHLDVEGMEYKVLKGAANIIKTFEPIITYEQHIDKENIDEIFDYLKSFSYNIFLIDEILPGCWSDCRNFIAFPSNIDSNIIICDIHQYLGFQIIKEIKHSNKTTIITGYYHIASNDRTSYENFLAGGEKLLKINQPMIIFCEPGFIAEQIFSIRAELNLASKTHIITCPLENLELYPYLSVFDSNPDKNLTNRNNMVHLICISKFIFIRDAIKVNPFNTDYFAWIDFNLLAKKPHNSNNYINDKVFNRINIICNNPKPKFSLTVLNFWNSNTYSKLTDYYSKYHYIVAGLFLTMPAKDGLFIMEKLIEKVHEISKLGYGHGEESFYAYIIDKYPELFSLYIGDYQDAIHNYYKLNSNEYYVDWVIGIYKDNNHLKRLIKILNDFTSEDDEKLGYLKKKYLAN